MQLSQQIQDLQQQLQTKHNQLHTQSEQLQRKEEEIQQQQQQVLGLYEFCLLQPMNNCKPFNNSSVPKMSNETTSCSWKKQQ